MTNRIGYEEQIPGQLRDWNEELQSAKELPKKTQHQRVLRDRALYKVSCIFQVDLRMDNDKFKARKKYSLPKLLSMFLIFLYLYSLDNM